MTLHWLSSLMAAVGMAFSGGEDKDALPFERDGDTVRVTAPSADDVYLVLGSSSKGVGAAGPLEVVAGSASFAADSEITVYRLQPLGRWTGAGGRPQGIRCHGSLTDCPLPPPPIPHRVLVQLLVSGR